jgi:UDP-N-acetylmuramate--alanine ligase
LPEVPKAEPAATAAHPSGEIPDPRGPGRFHYAGVAGSGMSALAQFQVMSGGLASGSDRAFDRGERALARAQLERLGVSVYAQDGRALSDDCAALVVSTAVEEQVADVVAAKERGIPVIHRAELLAYYVERYRTIAVAGTSGKSTVVAMIFEILHDLGRSPSVITGGELLMLQRERLWGNAWHGSSDLLVVEADESDGSLVHYRPAVSVVLNLQRDHKEMDDVARMFTTLREHTRESFVVGEGENLAALAEGGTVFGFGPGAGLRGEGMTLGPATSRFAVQAVRFTLPVPGRHNVENALAALAVCRCLEVPLASMVAPLAGFEGVGRRFQSLGLARGVEVVDDFAHNPAKLQAAIGTAQSRRPAGRVLAVYQPHGYGPTRFLRDDFVATFSDVLRAEDRLWMLEVYYAGGTATRDFSAADIVGQIAERGTLAEFAPSREWLAERISQEARAGDLVLVMGARDPTLTQLARTILDTLGRQTG